MGLENVFFWSSDGMLGRLHGRFDKGYNLKYEAQGRDVFQTRLVGIR